MSKKWREENPERWKAMNAQNVKRWRENNPDKYKQQYMTYNHKKLQAKKLDKK